MTSMQQLCLLLVTQIPSKMDRLPEDLDLLSLFQQWTAAEQAYDQQTSKIECNDDQKL